MAQRLLLTNDDGTEQIDLFLGVLKCTNWQWNPQPTALNQRIVQLPFGTQASSVGYPQVVEIMTLGTEGCPEDIRAALRQLEEFLENAAAYMDDPTDGDPHWLVWSSEGELGKRALVTGGKHTPVNKPPESWQQLDGPWLTLTLALTRAPMWEQPTTDTVAPAAVGTFGGMMVIPNVEGRVPARIRYIEFSHNDAGSDVNPLTTLWVGLRSIGTATVFDPNMECESIAGGGEGILGAGTVDVADGTPAGVTYVAGAAAEVTFADTVNRMRVQISINNLLVPAGSWTDAEDYAGRYLILCRCLVDMNGDTVYPTVQLRSGYLRGVMATHDQIVIDHTAPLFVELGEIQIPPPGIPATPYPAASRDYLCALSTVELWAQSLDAAHAAKLYLDELVLIPTDFFLKMENAAIGQDAGGVYEYLGLVMREPDERLFGVLEWDAVVGTGDPDNAWIATVTVAGNQWYLPEGRSLLVLAGERATEQALTDDVTVNVVWYPRWTNYRE